MVKLDNSISVVLFAGAALMYGSQGGQNNWKTSKNTLCTIIKHYKPKSTLVTL